jgi:hypothetical protein
VRVESDEAVDGGQLNGTVDELGRLAGQDDTDALLRLMDEVVPGAAIRSTPPPDMTSLV